MNNVKVWGKSATECVVSWDDPEAKVYVSHEPLYTLAQVEAAFDRMLMSAGQGPKGDYDVDGSAAAFMEFKRALEGSK